ncbi:PREDICTED: uncharacterized protein LOC108369207 isoform X1 [Rhagoletis zephyria]|uniref:uncharacterized protein LOC108369207 isoform X1 n=1 Tax=Rhagoletis zephyria TaxID=28612 RepID=UPI00081151A4|nr:PREDICTED: uncharacterized protein LOC108369207 isoform X1 [Rhagoletis zephyria]
MRKMVNQNFCNKIIEHYCICCRLSTTAHQGGECSKILTKTALCEALSLLASWNLQNLCKKFKGQKVCTVAFRYLTDDDICELIPNIGPRAIFRSHLLAWRQQQEMKKDGHVILLNSDQVDTTIAIKNELPEITPEEEHAINMYEDAKKESELYEDSDSKTVSVMCESKCD